MPTLDELRWRPTSDNYIDGWDFKTNIGVHWFLRHTKQDLYSFFIGADDPNGDNMEISKPFGQEDLERLMAECILQEILKCPPSGCLHTEF